MDHLTAQVQTEEAALLRVSADMDTEWRISIRRTTGLILEARTVDMEWVELDLSQLLLRREVG